MRDKRFVAEHRGGILKPEQQRQLMTWACSCARHIMSILEINDDRLENVLLIAEKWVAGESGTGEAMKAALKAHAIARESPDPVAASVARAVGHAVSTAHMADHSLGAALYGLRALKTAGKQLTDERQWQNEQLPAEIRELVLSSRPVKEKAFGLLQIGN